MNGDECPFKNQHQKATRNYLPQTKGYRRVILKPALYCFNCMCYVVGWWTRSFGSFNYVKENFATHESMHKAPISESLKGAGGGGM